MTASLTDYFLLSGATWLKKRLYELQRNPYWLDLSVPLSFLSVPPSCTLTALLNRNKKSLKSNGLVTLRSSGSSQRQPQMSSQADMFGPYQESSSKALQWCQSHSSLVWIMELCRGTSPFLWCYMTADTILREIPRLIMETLQSRCAFHHSVIHSMNL